MSEANPEMRGDIHPLCQRHLTPMMLSEVRFRFFRDDYPIAVFQCPQSQCSSCYEMHRGYFDAFPDERPMVPDEVTRSKCPHHVEFRALMYIADFDEETGRRTWRCSVEQCNVEVTEELPLGHTAASEGGKYAQGGGE